MLTNKDLRNLIFLFTALLSGGAVIISQYIGKKEQETAIWKDRT